MACSTCGRTALDLMCFGCDRYEERCSCQPLRGTVRIRPWRCKDCRTPVSETYHDGQVTVACGCGSYTIAHRAVA